MDRHEAITCLKEIQKACFNMSPDIVELVNSKIDDKLSVGYQLHIQAALDQSAKKQIRAIAEKHQLSIHEEPRKIVIYKSAVATS